MHHDENTSPATEYHSTLCGLGDAVPGGSASSCRGIRSSWAILLQLYPQQRTFICGCRWGTWSFQEGVTLVPHASMRAGETHRPAAKVSRALHAEDDAGLWSIERLSGNLFALL